MTREEIFRAMDDVAGSVKSWVRERGMRISPSFHFTGGEPLLHADLFPILEHGRRSGFSLALMTNGLLVTKNVAARLRDAGVGAVQVSLEGLQAVHDSIRGKGAFARALRGIENLAGAGIDTHINLTLSRTNVSQMDGLVSLAGNMGIGAVTFSRLVPCGRGEELASEVLSAHELAAFFDAVDAHNRSGTLHVPGGSGMRDAGCGKPAPLASRISPPERSSTSHVPGPEQPRSNTSAVLKTTVRVTTCDPLSAVAHLDGDVPGGDFPMAGCAAGVFGVTIASDGSIMPCRRMDLAIGNIRDGNFRQLWAGSPVLWSLRTRGHYHDGCDSCRYWAVCRGCRAIALAAARARGQQDYLGPDPQCPYRHPA